MSLGLIILYGEALLMFLPLLYIFLLASEPEHFTTAPLPRSEELCLSEALTTVFSALYQALTLGSITAVKELTWHWMRSFLNDGAVLVGYRESKEAGASYRKLLPPGLIQRVSL